MSGLLGVATIALFDGDADQQARGSDLVRPHRFDVGHAGSLHVLANERRARDGPIARQFVGGAEGWASEDDRVVAVIDGLDIEDRLLADVAGVVAGPLTERPLLLALLRIHKAFQRDLRVRRDGKAGDLARNDLHRFAAQAAHDVVLADAVRRLAAGQQEGQGIAAQDDHRGHRLVPRLVLVAVDAAVLAGRDVEADGFLIVNHHPVRAEVHPVLLGIARDVEAAGADVAAAVVLVPDRRRELRHVDVVTHHDVLEDRSATDFPIWDGLHLFEAVLQERFAQLELRQARLVAEGHVLAFPAEEVGKNAETLRVAGHVVEDDTRRSVRVHGDLRGHADVFLPRGAANDLDLAEFLRLGDPFAKVVVNEVHRRGAAGLAFDVRCRPGGLVARHWYVAQTSRRRSAFARSLLTAVLHSSSSRRDVVR